jgi:hypothetical protein
MPGLLTLNTDLKSLKYGYDQPNGGSSREPYIKVDINSVDATFNKVRLTKFDDGLVRGGMVGAINASVVDTLRIGKFFTDFPKGPLFLTKQVGLQLSNPQLEHKTDLPTNQTGTNRPTRGQGLFNNIGNAATNAVTSVGAFISRTANRIENKIGPTRIYNLGVNTLAQIPLNAFGGHVVRHGFLPTEDPSKYYEAVVTQNNFQNNHNRLEQYASDFSLGGMDTILDKTNYNTSTTITSYIGGPSSVYGIGQTFIRRWSNSNDKFKIEFAQSQSKYFAGRTRGDNGDVEVLQMEYRFKGASTFSSSIYASGSFPALGDPIGLDDRNAVSNINEDKTGIYHWNKNSPVESIKIKDTIDYGLSEKTRSDFAPTSSFIDLPTQLDSLPSPSFIYKVASSNDVSESNIKFKLSLDSVKSENDLVSNGPSSYPGVPSGIAKLDIFNTVYDYGSPSVKTYATIQKRLESGSRISQNYFSTEDVSIDRTNPQYIYNTGAPIVFNRTNDRVLADDEIKVIFTPINPFTLDETPNQFLAYLSSYSENYDSGWNEIRYAGRAESFYVFNSFKRTISFGLQVPCYNQDELVTNHNKLFALGNKGLGYALAGQYSENNLMGGVITKLTVGNYIVDSPGIINSMKFDIIDNSSWDLDLQYAHYIKVDFQFTVIGNQLPLYDQIPQTVLPPPTPEPDPNPVPPPPPTPPPAPIIPPATTDYLGKGAGFETSQGRTDAQRAFNERQIDRRFGFNR